MDLSRGGDCLKQALLVIDAQQALIDGDHAEKGVVEKENLIKNINTVIQMAVENGSAIVFIRDVDVAKGEGPGFEVHQEINVPAGAVTFNKTATNAFYGTPLDAYLKEHSIKHIVMMGCKTEYCIDTAVRTATVSGYDVTLVGNAHSTADSDTLSGQQIIQHHNRTLHGHYNVDNFSLVRNSDEDLFTPTHDNYR